MQQGEAMSKDVSARQRWRHPNDRNLAILRERLEGVSMGDLAEKHGISRARVKQIVDSTSLLIRWASYEIERLTYRVERLEKLLLLARRIRGRNFERIPVTELHIPPQNVKLLVDAGLTTVGSVEKATNEQLKEIGLSKFSVKGLRAECLRLRAAWRSRR